MEGAARGLRSLPEPAQLCAVTPDGSTLFVGVLRAWAADFGTGKAPAGDVVVSLDLESADGRLMRSSAPATLMEHAPALAPMLAWQWQEGNVTA